MVAMLGAVGFALALAAPASADHENRSRPWWDRNVSRERPEADDVHWRHRHDRDGSRYYDYGYRDGRGHHGRRASYQCAPCRHRWHDYGAFRSHLNHHHHVPIWRIPFVMVEAAFGWVFYG
jgi:hypothetical protein